MTLSDYYGWSHFESKESINRTHSGTPQFDYLVIEDDFKGETEAYISTSDIWTTGRLYNLLNTTVRFLECFHTTDIEFEDGGILKLICRDKGASLQFGKFKRDLVFKRAFEPCDMPINNYFIPQIDFSALFE